MEIANNAVVTMEYTLTNEANEVMDSSKGREPLAYIHGIGALIPGLEKELNGKKEGDKLQSTIAPEDAYGTRTPELVQKVPVAQFQGDEKIEVGMQIQGQTPEGHTSLSVVIDVNDEEITLDGNHPLADMTLNFDIEIVGVREATQEELDHGHVHGPGGHQH